MGGLQLQARWCHAQDGAQVCLPHPPPSQVNGVVMKFQPPPEAVRCTNPRWRLYVFKGDTQVGDPLPLDKFPFFLFGKERRVADIPTDHPSCSRQHAVIVFRWGGQRGAAAAGGRPQQAGALAGRPCSGREGLRPPLRAATQMSEDAVAHTRAARSHPAGRLTARAACPRWWRPTS